MLDHLAADRTRVADLTAQILHLEESLGALQGKHPEQSFHVLHLEQSLRSLRPERDLAQQRLASYYYPVLDLPTEITCEIFLHFLPVHPLCVPLTGINSPTLLTEVCRAWRAIALGTPSLWRAILLPPVGALFTEQHTQILDLWFTRSGSCPLSVDNVDDHYYGGDGVLPSLSRVLQHASRLEELTAHLPVHPMLRTARPLPILRRLDLSLDSWPIAQEILIFSDAPQLRTVTLNDSAALGVLLPWSQVTSVTLNVFYEHECATVLKKTSNLQHCELMVIDGGQSMDFPEISLPHLTFLTLVGDERYDPVAEFLDTLLVPALRTLRVPESFLGADPIDTLTRFVAKSNCKLQELCITDGIAAKDRYRPAFPLIRRLSFRGWRPAQYPGTEREDVSEVDELEDL
ncbi:hypothetical protein C8R46DRAFT_1125614 [Mycena filopes]|nr:hypothetical protein C8R46DRAFT_1125614 [Mycena filopes]